MEAKNVVYIGQKPVMSYVLAVMTAFRGENKEVSIMARGRSISTAVDVAEVVRNQFMKDLSVRNINISTETVKTEEGGSRNISSIRIVLSK